MIEPKDWYHNINKLCAELSRKHGVPLIKVAGIMSALSVNTTFEQNIKSLERFLAMRGDCKVSTYTAQKNKALEILTGGDLTIDCVKAILSPKIDGGLKTKAFFDNIYRPIESIEVTIDRWMIRWAGIEGSLTPKRYAEISNRVRKLAYKNGLRPHEQQALIWVNVRGDIY